MEQTKARAGESLTRISGSVADYANKKYWTQAQNEVRQPGRRAPQHKPMKLPAAHLASCHAMRHMPAAARAVSGAIG